MGSGASAGADILARPDDRDQLVDGNEDKVRITLHDQRAGGVGGDMISDVASGAAIDRSAPVTSATTFVPRGRPGQAGNLPQWLTVMRMFAPIQYSSMMFILWFMGFGIGLVFSFLFWHLQDIGGTPTLFGFASVVNHVSELIAYMFIHRICVKIGRL